MQAFHYWRHLGQRILWVIDIALMSHNLPYFLPLLGTAFDQQRINMLTIVASYYLGLDNAFSSGDTPPHWLRAALERQWAINGYPEPTLHALSKSPHSFFAIMLEHWTEPIHATIHLKAPFDGEQRLHLQVLSYILRLLSFPMTKARKQLGW